MYSYVPPYMAEQKHDDQLEHTYSSYVRIRDVSLKTCQRRWTIGRSGERGSGISVLEARHDDDDDDDESYLKTYHLSFGNFFFNLRYTENVNEFVKKWSVIQIRKKSFQSIRDNFVPKSVLAEEKKWKYLSFGNFSRETSGTLTSF